MKSPYRQYVRVPSLQEFALINFFQTNKTLNSKIKLLRRLANNDKTINEIDLCVIFGTPDGGPDDDDDDDGTVSIQFVSGGFFKCLDLINNIIQRRIVVLEIFPVLDQEYLINTFDMKILHYAKKYNVRYSLAREVRHGRLHWLTRHCSQVVRSVNPKVEIISDFLNYSSNSDYESDE